MFLLVVAYLGSPGPRLLNGCVCNRVLKAVDVPKDGFLNEQNVAASLLDLLDNVEYVLSFVT